MARGVCPGRIRRSLACSSAGEQGGGGRLSSQQKLPDQLPAPSFAHSDSLHPFPSPLPLGVPIGCPKKSALLIKKISIVSFSSFFFPFWNTASLFFHPDQLSDPFHCTTQAFELAKEKGEGWTDCLSWPPLHNRRRMEMQLRENTSNTWWWKLPGWRSSPFLCGLTENPNAFLTHFVSVLEKAKAKSCSVIHSRWVLHPKEQKMVWTVLISFHFVSGFDCFALVKLKDTDQTEMTAKVWAAEHAVEICQEYFMTIRKSSHSLRVFYAIGLQMNAPYKPKHKPAFFPPITRSLGFLMLSDLWCRVNALVLYRTGAPRRVFMAVFWVFFPGELYFMSTGVPSATAPHGVVYKVVDTSRYEMFLLQSLSVVHCVRVRMWRMMLTD